MTSKAKLLAVLAAVLILLAACDSLIPAPRPQPEPEPEPDTIQVQSGPEMEVQQPEEPEPGGQAWDEEDAGVYRGEITEDVYTNASIGLSFTLPGSEWRFADDETIAMMMGVEPEDISGDGWTYFYEGEVAALYDMMAYNAETGSNTMVVIENLGLVPGAAPPTAGAHLEALRERLEEMDIFGFEFGQAFQSTINGETFEVLPIDVEALEREARQYYFVRIQGGYAVSIIASIFDDITVEELISHFS